jgi:hypothetical protein
MHQICTPPENPLYDWDLTTTFEKLTRICTLQCWPAESAKMQLLQRFSANQQPHRAAQNRPLRRRLCTTGA